MKQIKIDCVNYFKQSTVWKIVLSKFKEKYYSYGRFSGKVILKNLQMQEVEELEGFFGKSFHGQKSITISAEKFKKALEASRYGEVTPEELLENFFGEPLIGKKAQKELQEQKKQGILARFLKDYQKTPIVKNLDNLLEVVKNSQNLTEWENLLWLGAKIYNGLPYRSENKTYLAVFAAMLTGNPHSFDTGTQGGNFLYQIIQMDLEERNLLVEESELFPAYRRQKGYLMTGIMIDDISNYTMLYHVQAVKKDGNLHRGIEGFLKEDNIIQVPLTVVAEWDELICSNKEIYIVENPSVFAMLCEKNRLKKEYEKSSIMCMNGQPRLASLLILELLSKNQNRVYYAGDFDPEGLLIAQKLSKYYKGEFYFWHMTKTDYEKCNSKEIISSRRMKMLDKITDEHLVPVSNEILRCKTAGYQENLNFYS